MSNDLKILTLDIETKPIKAYVWKIWDQNIGLNQIIEDGGVICVGLKWEGKPVEIYSEWEHGHLTMLENVHAALRMADVVISYNGARFDLPLLNGEFLLHGLPPIPPVTHIDLFKTVKKFKFLSSKLEYIGPLLKLGKKIKHEGFELWVKVLKGDPKAQKAMEEYCKMDVVLTEKLYKAIRPFITDHPYLQAKPGACPACGSEDSHKRGFRLTRFFKIQRNQCKSCNHWFQTTRSKVS